MHKWPDTVPLTYESVTTFNEPITALHRTPVAGIFPKYNLTRHK
jgi:hypothetical protein